MENVYKVPNFLLPEEIEEIDRILADENLWAIRSEKKKDPDLGRVVFTVSNVIKKAEKALNKTIMNPEGTALSCTFAHYESSHGQPNLAPHFDGDNNSVIIDYQYKSNTSWPIGLDTEIFEMQDNEALIFNPNQYPHWRPHKNFQDGEFVTMIFFRFPDFSGATDYSHLQLNQADPIFDKAKAFRDELGFIKSKTKEKE
jgi:hypothetical protein